jgi:hypothetical protein
MSRDQNVGRSHSIKTGNSSFEIVEDFKYLGKTLTNQNSIQIKEQIKFRDCLLSFSAESFVFKFANQKCRD